jgi:hypothetical protein
MDLPLHVLLLLSTLGQDAGPPPSGGAAMQGPPPGWVTHAPPREENILGTINPYDPEGLYLSPGGIVGSSTVFGEGGTTSWHIGGELSLMWMDAPWGYGLVTDALYDYAAGRTRVSVGAQAVWYVLGLSAGYVASLDGTDALHGLQYSAFLTFGIFAFEFRHVVLFDAPDEFDAVFLLKLPFEVYARFYGPGFWFCGSR